MWHGHMGFFMLARGNPSPTHLQIPIYLSVQPQKHPLRCLNTQHKGIVEMVKNCCSDCFDCYYCCSWGQSAWWQGQPQQ